VAVITCAVVVLTCFLMCGCVYVWVSFGTMCTVLVFSVCCVVCIVSFTYMFSYVFCLYCHQVTTQFQLIITIVIIIIIIMLLLFCVMI
jgi:hypothetical protein